MIAASRSQKSVRLIYSLQRVPDHQVCGSFGRIVRAEHAIAPEIGLGGRQAARLLVRFGHEGGPAST